MENLTFAFLITLLAGLSTGIGSCIAFFAKSTNKNFLSVSLGFSAGVMIYVSMIELFSEAQVFLSGVHGEKDGLLYTTLAFLGGIFLIAFIDKLISHQLNPDAIKTFKNTSNVHQNSKLMRTGLFTALAIAIHNFPEGLATFVAALQDPSIAIPIVLAIVIHNIPEGVAISVPIYHATGSKKKAFFYSFSSGLAAPAGAIVGYLLLLPFMTDTVYGIIFASVAGIMVFISLNELLPAAREYGKYNLANYGLIGGMAVMGLSLWLFV